MVFINPKNGNIGNVPWSISEANLKNFTRYMDDEGCDICKLSETGRFIACNSCVNCALNRAAVTWNAWLKGQSNCPKIFPRSADQARNLGVNYFYRERTCLGGDHFMQPDISTGKCVACAKIKLEAKPNCKDSVMHNMPDLILNREEAQQLGFDTYNTGMPCKRSHKAYRYVSNGGCIACMRGKPEGYGYGFEKIDMTKLVTIAEQALLFVGYAWDGRRTIDSRGNKYTIAQFNFIVGGNARYEVKNAKDVFTSHGAFMANFISR